jgi:aconitase B
VVDLDAIVEPMIADPDVNNEDVSKRYTHDVIRPASYYNNRKVDLGFVGSCMVHKGDMKIIAAMLRNLEQKGPINRLLLATAAGTYFKPQIKHMNEAQNWMTHTSKSMGQLIVARMAVKYSKRRRIIRVVCYISL